MADDELLIYYLLNELGVFKTTSNVAFLKTACIDGGDNDIRERLEVGEIGSGVENGIEYKEYSILDISRTRPNPIERAVRVRVYPKYCRGAVIAIRDVRNRKKGENIESEEIRKMENAILCMDLHRLLRWWGGGDIEQHVGEISEFMNKMKKEKR